MNDLSPPDASAAPMPAVSPPPTEPPEPASGPRNLLAGAAPARTSSAPAVTPPDLVAEPRWLAEPAPAAAPAPDLYALPLVSEDDPCGPDLDLEGDTEFMNFIAATEGLLPASYYAFNRATIDFPAALQAAEKLLKRTLDLRLIVLMAKLSILNRDVVGFAQRIGNVAWLVKEHWEGANPRGRGRRLFGAYRAIGDARG